MITPIQLDTAWREYWNLWSPPAVAQIAPLADSRCYAPRIRMVPDVNQQIMPTAGKIEFDFTLEPGSLIWCLWAGPSAQLDFTFQLTQVELDHPLFEEPSSTRSLPNSVNAQSSGNTSPYNYAMLPTPWPVVGEGLFMVEIWGTAALRYFLMLGIAEVSECLP